ncbi:MAG: T9SS type A sorting domain-containing protein [Bacteroidales bacterium]|nr:T9SS type A sorting domain-containing protein [Bacteroidales bacterium]
MRINIIFLILFGVKIIYSQVPLEHWKYYLSFYQGKFVEDANDIVYCATEKGIFYIKKSDNSLHTLSKLEGLSDININCIKYIKEHKTLFIGYKNGNIDLLTNNVIYNISYIKESNILGDKAIYNAFYYNNNLYLSCGFGIVVLNLITKNITENYFIGEYGQNLCVYAISIKDNEIIAATKRGLYISNLTLNLANYTNWTKLSNLPYPNESYSFITHFSNSIFVIFNNSQLYYLHNNVWQTFNDSIKNVKGLKNCGNYLLAIVDKKIYKINKNFEIETITNEWFAPADATLDNNGYLWFADMWSGLGYRTSSGNFFWTKPSGPSTNTFFRIDAIKNSVWLTHGGINSAYNNLWLAPQIYNYSNNSEWYTINPNSDTILKGIFDICPIRINPNNKDEVVCGSFGGGLIFINAKEKKVVNLYNDKNSSLQSAIPGSPYVRVTGIDYDENNNLWIANSEVEKQLSVFTSDKKWKSFSLSAAIGSKKITGELIVTKSGQKWIILPKGGGLVVFNENNTIDNEADDKVKKITIIDQNGELVSNDAFCMALDKNELLWIGTSNGIVYYDTKQDIFKEDIRAQRIKLPNEIPGQANYLFESQTITAIAVDGANNKWIGTLNGGVFLMNSDCSKQIYNFTKDNSPLLSDYIIDIAIEPFTGEVFFVTDAGLCSFRGTATEGSENNNNVVVFPNPVKSGYNGLIAIRGLVENAYVKITDIAGNLVYETKAQGGQAIWNGKNHEGKRVQTGIYLVFITNNDGSETFVAKIMFFN